MSFREGMFKAWYWYISKVDKDGEVQFMNYGFSDPGSAPLNLENEADKYSIQLYHKLAGEAVIENKEILEIGSGRGGGLAFVCKHFRPKKALGLELNQRAVTFCNKHYQSHRLAFVQGDAQDMKLESGSFDVVLNVESSHRYPKFRSFLSEVHRVLRPGGYLLLSDFRYDWEMEEFEKDMLGSELSLLKKEDITVRVLEALILDDQRKRDLVKKLAPRILHKKALCFAGAVGSPTYNSFASREFLYINYILQKKA